MHLRPNLVIRTFSPLAMVIEASANISFVASHLGKLTYTSGRDPKYAHELFLVVGDMLCCTGCAAVFLRARREWFRKVDPDSLVFVLATELEDEWPVVSVDFLLYIQSMRRFMAGLQSKNTCQDYKQLRPIPLGNLLLWLKIQGGLVRGMGSSAFGGSNELAHFCSSPALPCDKFWR